MTELEHCGGCRHRDGRVCRHPDHRGAPAILPPVLWRRRDLALVAAWCPLPPPRWADDSRDTSPGRPALDELAARYEAIGAAPLNAIETHKGAVDQFSKAYRVAGDALDLLRRATE